MRYITSREENWTWLILSACWAAGALLGWGYSLLAANPPVADSVLLLIATVVAVIGLALRLPILTAAPHVDGSWDRVVMLTGYLATINWLGLIMLHASGVGIALLAMLIVVSVETWLLCQYFLYGCLRFAPLLENVSAPKSELGVTPESATAALFGTPHEKVGAKFPVDAVSDLDGDSDSRGFAEDIGALQAGECESEDWVRRSVEGVDADGSRYLSGEIQVHLQPRQASQEIMLGFCPPFVGNPQFDFELSDERASASLIRLSPAGAHLRLRRSSDAGKSRQEVDLELQWYAVQPSEPLLPEPSLP